MKAPQIPVNEAERMRYAAQINLPRSTIIPRFDRLTRLATKTTLFSGCRWR